MDAGFLSILPNLSIGVVSVLTLGYLSLRHAETQKKSQEAFLVTLDTRADKHEVAMKERETAMRGLEASVRTSMADQLTKNTIALTDVAKVLGRVVRHFDSDK